MNNRKQIEDQAYSMLQKNDLEGMGSTINTNPWLLTSTFDFGGTLLHDACWNDQAQMAELLLSLGADVNSKGSFSRDEQYTPLSWGINKMGTDTLKVLVKYHADLNFGGPIYRAFVREDKGRTLAIALLKAGATNRANEVFTHAVMAGDEELVDLFLAHHFSPDIKDDDGKSLLTWAANNSSSGPHYRIAEKLLAQGAKLENRDKQGYTPLYWAVSSRFRSAPLINLAKLYLDHGAKIDSENYEGVTPLLYAAENGELTMLELLAARVSKVDMAQRDNHRNTILHFAALNFNNGVCQYFIDKGFDCNEVNSTGDSPLHFACDSHKYDNVAALLQAGAKVTIKNKKGKTPLDDLKKYPSIDDPNYEKCVKTLEQLEIIEKSREFKQIQKESELPAQSITLKSGNFIILADLADRKVLSAKSEYFKTLFNQYDLDKSNSKNIDLSEKFNEHIFRCMIIIFSGMKNVVKSLDTATALLMVG
ncbi:MAG: ankyrin repeat protein [uncultured bacterium]|nr:MAG: ankyrin repeat protein [uncultured bacterium]